MNKTPEEMLKKNQKKLLIISVIDAPGMIMLALGLHGKFSKSGSLLHPVLANETVHNLLLIIGGIIVLLCAIKAVSLVIEQAKIRRK